MLQLIQVMSDGQPTYETSIRQLFLEYIQWLHKEFNQAYGITVDENEILQDFMESIEVFYPPKGRIYLAKFGNGFAGVGCLKQLGGEIAEIKRMFVRNEYRRKGIGKTLLDQLIAEATAQGYSKIRLDSPKISMMAHDLYRSRGFQYIESYEGSEAAQSIPDLAVYMELVL